MTKLQPDQYSTETYPCNGRLTLANGSPITTTDQSDKSTLYFTPYLGNYISLHDGSSTWNTIKFVEKSLNISAYTASKPYDIWGYNNSGSLTLDSTVWTNATTRATALTSKDGIYCKSGSTTRRYLGTIYINSSGSNTSDADAKRFVWNYYNKIDKRIRFNETTGSWTYNSGTWRQMNNNSANKVEFMIGISGYLTLANQSVDVYLESSGASGGISIALDTVSGISSNSSYSTSYLSYSTGTITSKASLNVFYSEYISSGYHYLAAVETGNGTNTFYGGAEQLFVGKLFG